MDWNEWSICSHTYRRFWHTRHVCKRSARQSSSPLLCKPIIKNSPSHLDKCLTNNCECEWKSEKIPLSHSIHLLPDISRADAHQRPRILSIVFGVLSVYTYVCLRIPFAHIRLSVLLSAPTAPIPHVDLSILLVLVLWNCVHASLAWMHECLDGINEHLIDVQSSHDKHRRNDVKTTYA